MFNSFLNFNNMKINLEKINDSFAGACSGKTRDIRLTRKSRFAIWIISVYCQDDV